MSRYEHDLTLELDGAVEVPPSGRVAAGAVLVVAVVLIALNLRPAVTSVGPVLGDMQRALGASACGPACSPRCPDCASQVQDWRRRCCPAGSGSAGPSASRWPR